MVLLPGAALALLLSPGFAPGGRSVNLTGWAASRLSSLAPRRCVRPAGTVNSTLKVSWATVIRSALWAACGRLPGASGVETASDGGDECLRQLSSLVGGVSDSHMLAVETLARTLRKSFWLRNHLIQPPDTAEKVVSAAPEACYASQRERRAARCAQSELRAAPSERSLLQQPSCCSARAAAERAGPTARKRTPTARQRTDVA